MNSKIFTLLGSSFLLLMGTTSAQETGAQEAASSISHLDTAFLLICAALVFIMQAGFCLVEMGFSRAKNSINIIMKNMCDMGAGSIMFFLVGFGLMYGWSRGGYFATGNLPFDSSFGAEHPVWIFFLFQVMFAAATATISSGAMAERTYFPGYLIYAVLGCGVIYPFLGHWAWGGFGADFGFGGGNGWLADLGFKDFAGGTVVHGVGGAFALAGIMVIGPRKGRFSEDGSAKIFPGHNVPLASLGMFLLFFGWFGFNCGSVLAADGTIGRIAVNTMLGSCGGITAALIFHWVTKGWADPGSAINGALGGLVAVTACSNVIAPWAAVVIGLVAGVLVIVAEGLLLKMKLDDAVGAVPVHLVCGIWGTLCVSIFNENGFFLNFGAQVLGAFLIPTVAFAIIWVVFILIDKTVGLRATDEAQDAGLDFAEHSSTAYPDFAINEEEL